MSAVPDFGFIDIISSRIDDILAQKGTALAAIDGRCGSGKTTLAARLAAKYGCGVVHMDDFYLRKEQRSAERYAEPGGNVDRERFLEEMLAPLSKGEPAVYRPLICSGLYLGDEVRLPRHALTVIEGSYSCHPALASHYDLKIFLDVSPDVQLERIARRNGAEKLESFKKMWIPLEETYFNAFKVPENCDLVFRTD